MKPADVTVFWIFGNGAVPFVKQYHDYGLTAPLAAPMSNNFSDAQLAELGDIGLGMIACDYYAYTIDNQQNKDFIAAYEKLYPGEKPTPQGYGAWQGVMMYIEALKATKGDTTPATVIKAMSNLTMDSPAGKFTVVPYQERLHRQARLLHPRGAEGRRRADLGAGQDLSAGACSARWRISASNAATPAPGSELSGARATCRAGAAVSSFPLSFVSEPI